MTIRRTEMRDIATITAIYRHYVLTSAATFEEHPPDESEVARRFRTTTDGGYTHLVAEDGGAVIGYAYSTPWRLRPAYRFTVEDSIYLRPESHRKGVGRALLHSLIEAERAAGRKQMIAVVGDSANVASIGLHEAIGFRRVGVLQNVGWKFERWVDTTLLQLAL